MSDSITDGQRLSVKRTVEKSLKDHGLEKNADIVSFVLSKLFKRKVDGPFDKMLTRNDWLNFRQAAFPNWTTDNWTTGDNFRIGVANLIEEYQEQVLGQQRLF